jgi:hypothetical protein
LEAVWKKAGASRQRACSGTERKPWKRFGEGFAGASTQRGRAGNCGNSFGDLWGREHECSVDGLETVGNSSGNLGKTVEIAWGSSSDARNSEVGTGFPEQIQSTRLRRKKLRPRLVKWFPNAGRWDMRGRKFVAGGLFVAFRVAGCSARASSSDPCGHAN